MKKLFVVMILNGGKYETLTISAFDAGGARETVRDMSGAFELGWKVVGCKEA